MRITIEEFVNVIRSLFKEDGVTIEATTEFRELEEWSSMQALLVIPAVDEHFGVTLPEKEFRNANTLQNLYDVTIRLA
ncbi:MAG: acyl carrier protein [Flavobacteriales bacterium]|nr:acyl carrier protein [Flavobacteriales bacterium]